MTGIETLILTLIHPSLYINTHTSISISYRYSYLNIKYIDLSLCGSSLPIHVIHPIPGPWLHANLAAQTNNYMRKRNRQLYSSSMESQPVLLDSRRCTMVRQDALWWNWMSQAKMRASASLRQFWLTHADALHFQIQLTSVATAVDLYLGTSTDTTLGPASLWTQQDLPHCITSGDRKISMPNHKQVKQTCTRTFLRERRSGNACGHVCSDSSGSKQTNIRANLSKEMLC